MRFGLKEEVIENIICAIKGYKSVQKAVIFGSRARGDYKFNSDIDLAVWAVGGLPAGLIMDLDEVVGIYKIDVVDMAGLHNGKISSRIEEQGVEIYNKEKEKHEN